MKSKRIAYSRKLTVAGIVLSALCLGMLAFGQTRETNSSTAGGPTDYDLSRYTIDGGGAMFSTGADFELSGTVGQPDTGTMSGGDFTLAGGFWFPIASGDCNVDGGVNLFDFASFDRCLGGPVGGLLDPSCICFDADGNRIVDLRDFGSFQRGFSGP